MTDARAMEIFNEVADLEPAARSARLGELCGDDAELRARVEHMLAADAEGSLGEVVRGVFNAERPSERLVGTTIGPYKLLKSLGEGGFGVVYLAEQREPVHRRVALKLIKPELLRNEDAAGVTARFELERETLKVLAHEHIARIFDAGATDAGVPYFAMEYVPGDPITTFCDEHKLGIEARIHLFRKVCLAVQHAHNNGIIHRDLSPSNVLVAMEDGQPVPKVIDFGVAKAVNPEMVGIWTGTITGQVIGKLEYMSPEQAKNPRSGVDIRSDVYALGVLLYELLTGVRPFDLKAEALQRVVQVIDRVDPPTPSSRLETLGTEDAERSQAIARSRQLNAQSLERTLRRELEWIPLMAMRKEPERRYRNAGDLADDLAAYLDGEALQAGPESRWYRARKVLRQHRGPVGAIVTIVLLLSGGLISTALLLDRATEAESDAKYQAGVAREEANRASAAEREASVRAETNQRIADFLSGQYNRFNGRPLLPHLRESLESAATREGLSSVFSELPDAVFTTAAIDLLKQGLLDPMLADINEGFADAPLLQAQLLHIHGNTLFDLGFYEESLEPLSLSYAIRKRKLGSEHPDTLKAGHNYGRSLAFGGDLEDARDLLERVLSTRRAMNSDAELSWIKTAAVLGPVYRRLGDATRAEELYREVIEVAEANDFVSDPFVYSAMNNLARLYSASERWDDALAWYQRSLSARISAVGRDHPDSATAMHNISGVLYELGRFEEAESYAREALSIRETHLGRNHIDALFSMNSLARSLTGLGRHDDALPVYRESYERSERGYGRFHPRTLTGLHNYADALDKLGRTQEAIPLARKSLDRRRTVYGDQHPRTLAAMAVLGTMLVLDSEAADEGLSLLSAALEGTLAHESLGAESGYALAFRHRLCVALDSVGRTSEALAHSKELIETARSVLSRDHPNVSRFEATHFEFAEKAAAMTDRLVLLVENPATVPGRIQSPAAVRSAAKMVDQFDALDQVHPESGFAGVADSWRGRLQQAGWENVLSRDD